MSAWEFDDSYVKLSFNTLMYIQYNKHFLEHTFCLHVLLISGSKMKREPEYKLEPKW